MQASALTLSAAPFVAARTPYVATVGQDGATWFDVFHAFKLLELLRAWPLCDMHGIGVDKDPVREREGGCAGLGRT